MKPLMSIHKHYTEKYELVDFQSLFIMLFYILSIVNIFKKDGIDSTSASG